MRLSSEVRGSAVSCKRVGAKVCACGGVCAVRGCACAMLSVIAMRRPEDEELGRGDGDEFVDISHMQLLVEAGPSGLHYGGPPPPLAQQQLYAQLPAHSVPVTATATSATASVDDLFALCFTSTSHGELSLCIRVY